MIKVNAHRTYPTAPHTPQNQRQNRGGQCQYQEWYPAPEDPSEQGLDQEKGEDHQKGNLDDPTEPSQLVWIASFIDHVRVLHSCHVVEQPQVTTQKLLHKQAAHA